MSQNKNNKYAEGWVPVKAIQENSILLDNGFRVVGVKISPKNIFILDNLSRDNVILGLTSVYNIINYEFWLLVLDRPVDLNLYVSQLQLELNEISNPVIRKVLLQDINKANIFMSKEGGVTDTEYFLLFKEKKQDVINKRIQELIVNLANAGLQASQATDEDLRALLDGFFNNNEKFEFGTVMYE